MACYLREDKPQASNVWNASDPFFWDDWKFAGFQRKRSTARARAREQAVSHPSARHSRSCKGCSHDANTSQWPPEPIAKRPTELTHRPLGADTNAWNGPATSKGEAALMVRRPAPKENLTWRAFETYMGVAPMFELPFSGWLELFGKPKEPTHFQRK